MEVSHTTIKRGIRHALTIVLRNIKGRIVLTGLRNDLRHFWKGTRMSVIFEYRRVYEMGNIMDSQRIWALIYLWCIYIWWSAWLIYIQELFPVLPGRNFYYEHELIKHHPMNFSDRVIKDLQKFGHCNYEDNYMYVEEHCNPIQCVVLQLLLSELHCYSKTI